jgi:membrane protein required for colicin V production
VEDVPIQGYDLLMLAILILATAFGAWKGLAWQVASFASLVVSCVVAVRFSDGLARFIPHRAPWNRFLAMLILFLLTSLAIWILFRLVAGLIDRVRLKQFDRQMGALVGLAKGVLLCLVITFFAVTLSEGVRQAVLHSHSGKFIARMIEHAAPTLPEEIRQPLGKYIDEFERQLDRDTSPDELPEDLSELLGSGPGPIDRRPGIG